jgi:cyclopropane fatty-acyl-phospholipid synthase-like methyltransferase
MNNSEAIQYWKKRASNNPDEKTIKVNSVNDFTQMDADFIMKYADENSEILDLASGTGLTINKYYGKVKHIDAVERFEEFSKFIVKTPRITIHNENINDFVSRKQYDIITMFGILHYFNEQEAIKIYERYKNFLKPNGRLIVKQQFGVKADVDVSGYSEELKETYYSQYRHIDKEVKILETIGYKNIEVVDIYPPECNRWENTHFYAIVGEK